MRNRKQATESLKERIFKDLKPNVKTKAFDASPFVKATLIIASVYGVLFVSKYFINEYANVIIAAKKLKNAIKK